MHSSTALWPRVCVIYQCLLLHVRGAESGEEKKGFPVMWIGWVHSHRFWISCLGGNNVRSNACVDIGIKESPSVNMSHRTTIYQPVLQFHNVLFLWLDINATWLSLYLCCRTLAKTVFKYFFLISLLQFSYKVERLSCWGRWAIATSDQLRRLHQSEHRFYFEDLHCTECDLVSTWLTAEASSREPTSWTKAKQARFNHNELSLTDRGKLNSAK